MNTHEIFLITVHYKSHEQIIDKYSNTRVHYYHCIISNYTVSSFSFFFSLWSVSGEVERGNWVVAGGHRELLALSTTTCLLRWSPSLPSCSSHPSASPCHEISIESVRRRERDSSPLLQGQQIRYAHVYQYICRCLIIATISVNF